MSGEIGLIRVGGRSSMLVQRWQVGDVVLNGVIENVGDQKFSSLVKPHVDASLWPRALGLFKTYGEYPHWLAAILMGAGDRRNLEEVLTGFEEMYLEFESVRASPANRELVIRETFHRLAFDLGFTLPALTQQTAEPARMSQR